MKKNLTIFVFIIVILAVALFACKAKPIIDDEGIISAVDMPEGYSAVDISAFIQNDDGGTQIKKVFKKQNKIVINTVTEGGYNGEVELVILLEQYKVSDIKALNIKETEGIGTKALSANFLSQFDNLDISTSEELAGGSRPSGDTDIVYVTGATYTSNAVIRGINSVIVWYNKNSAALNAA